MNDLRGPCQTWDRSCIAWAGNWQAWRDWFHPERVYTILSKAFVDQSGSFHAWMTQSRTKRAHSEREYIKPEKAYAWKNARHQRVWDPGWEGPYVPSLIWRGPERSHTRLKSARPERARARPEMAHFRLENMRSVAERSIPRMEDLCQFRELRFGPLSKIINCCEKRPTTFSNRNVPILSLSRRTASKKKLIPGGPGSTTSSYRSGPYWSCQYEPLLKRNAV